jgi:4-hydroxy-3-methylbut-2-enyl diphosphate reductase
VAQAADLDWACIPGRGTLGITAAASTPEASVSGIVRALRARFELDLEEVEHAEETTAFKPVMIG